MGVAVALSALLEFVVTQHVARRRRRRAAGSTAVRRTLRSSPAAAAACRSPRAKSRQTECSAEASTPSAVAGWLRHGEDTQRCRGDPPLLPQQLAGPALPPL